MKSRIPMISAGFLAAFVAFCLAVVGYQILYVWPIEQCEDRGHWWDEKDHVCAIPMPISQWTGRRVGGKVDLEYVRRPAPPKP